MEEELIKYNRQEMCYKCLPGFRDKMVKRSLGSYIERSGNVETETSLDIKPMMQSVDSSVPSTDDPQNSAIEKIFGSSKRKDDIVEIKIEKEGQEKKKERIAINLKKFL
uniref:Uncharacterized protein n=1 Tax=Glossina pallidipes TaxID=7398 RepID=A0A1A9ZSE6_GLOPL